MSHPLVAAKSGDKLLLSGNEAVARGVWEAGCHVAAAYPGTPSTEILENIRYFSTDEIYTEWSINEKVSLEVAIGASMAGSRAFSAMKHVGMNVASDAFMTQTLAGVGGGLVIAVADDVGFSSSQNEQDSRYWGRMGHMPILEPADSQEAYEMVQVAFDLSEQLDVPVILRMTTRICHVKALVTVGERSAKVAGGFKKDPARWVMTPASAKQRVPLMIARDSVMADLAAKSELNRIEWGEDRRVGYVTSGPAYMHVKEAFPDACVLKMGFTHPLPINLIKELAEGVEKLLIVEEVEPVVEVEVKAAAIGTPVHGKDLLPHYGELSPDILRPAVRKLLGEPEPEVKPLDIPITPVFPRPPTMCTACPHLGVFYTLSRVRNIHISGDIGCYTLGAGHPWEALDTCISMGASMGIALGLDKGRGESDTKKSVVAVIGDSTFLHMGMQGLLDIVYNRGNVTVMLLDNRAVGMTGGQDNPASGRNIHGEEAPRVDFRKLVEALGVRPERVREVDPYILPDLFKAVRQEAKQNEPSVIITNQPCVLIDDYEQLKPLQVIDDKCTGCANCLDVGCPAILVTRRGKEVKNNGQEVDLAWVTIESAACTGCDLCPKTCPHDAIVPITEPVLPNPDLVEAPNA
uniref:Indolepyruvate oxidoreductase subunit IorA n=1 Tax=Magnetococcus massalia (strain MO-1) TaxID=451514 RepID=A0A1S7LC26_MAGMO|nr:Indolepyruvate ferredoxin oxidoreductase, subunit iorA. 4Fe-4S ferredoxin, iron-sulfur binding:Thiamine pyrophosphate enzyme, C-terminal TPP-binding [Candidatus Magnetococcus massalia]